MDPSLLPSAIIWSRKVTETGPYLSSLADFTHCIFQSLTSARCCNYSYMCSWCWVELPPEPCRAVYRNIIKCTYSRILLDNYWHWFVMHGHMNIKKSETCSRDMFTWYAQQLLTHNSNNIFSRTLQCRRCYQGRFSRSTWWQLGAFQWGMRDGAAP